MRKHTPTLLLPLALAAALSACKAAPQASALKLHESSAQVVAFEAWPGIFLHGEPEVCTATAIAPRLLLTAAHCISGDYMKVVLTGTRAELERRLGTLEEGDYVEESDRPDQLAGYQPAGVFYRSTRVHKLVEYGETGDAVAELHPAFRARYTGVGVTPQEFYGRDGDKIGALDVAVVEFDKDVFPVTHELAFDFAAEGLARAELLAVGHGRRDDAGFYDGKRRQAKVGGELALDNGSVRARVPFATREHAILTGGDSGGPLLVKDASSGRYKILGVAQSGVLVAGDTIYGTLSDVPAELKTTRSGELFRESIWVSVQSAQVRAFIERLLP